MNDRNKLSNIRNTRRVEIKMATNRSKRWNAIRNPVFQAIPIESFFIIFYGHRPFMNNWNSTHAMLPTTNTANSLFRFCAFRRYVVVRNNRRVSKGKWEADLQKNYVNIVVRITIRSWMFAHVKSMRYFLYTRETWTKMENDANVHTTICTYENVNSVLIDSNVSSRLLRSFGCTKFRIKFDCDVDNLKFWREMVPSTLSIKSS